MPVIYYDRRFVKNQKWQITFTSGSTSATTNAVVASSILILAADYVLTALLFHK